MLGFYDYTGNIYLNTRNLKRISKQTIRQQVGLVVEDTYLFSGTIRENICLNKQVSQSQLDMVAKQASIYEDICKFSDGYDTLIGERGMLLSGGQQQRVALARMLLMNKSILILDEAISKIDEITKQIVLQNVVLENKATVFLITQDLSMLNKMDKVIFIHDKTSSFGTHQQLYENNQEYRNRIEVTQDIL